MIYSIEICALVSTCVPVFDNVGSVPYCLFVFALLISLLYRPDRGRVSKRKRECDSAMAVITEFSLSSCHSTCPACAEPCQKPHALLLEPHPSLACVFKQSVHRVHYIKFQAAQTSEFEFDNASSICPWTLGRMSKMLTQCVCGKLPLELSCLLDQNWARFDAYISLECWGASVCPLRLKPRKWKVENLNTNVWECWIRRERRARDLVGPAEVCNKIRSLHSGEPQQLIINKPNSRLTLEF